MAITEHSSTPAVVKGDDGDASLTTASFSPPSGSVVVAMVACGWDGATTTATVADSGGGGNWTQSAISATSEFNGMSGVAHKVFASAPGSMTVTVSFTNSTGPVQLDVRVLEGVDNTTPVGSTDTTDFTSSGTSVTASLSTSANSFVYGAASTNNHFDGTASGNANSTLLNFHYISGNYAATAYSLKSTSATSSGSASYGIDLNSASEATLTLVEFKQASGGSTVTGTMAATAPTAQVGASGDVVASGSVDATAPTVQTSAAGDVVVSGSVDATAPTAQASVAGEVIQPNTGTVDATAPTAQFEASGGSDSSGILSATAPTAQTSITGGADVPGTLNIVSPLAQVSIAGAPVVEAELATSAPLASVDVVASSGLNAGALVPTAPLAQVSALGHTRLVGRRVVVPEQDENGRVLEVPVDQPPTPFYV